MTVATMAKGLFATLFFISGMNSSFSADEAKSENRVLNSKKVQIIYFSKTGNTKKIAEYIQQFAGGEIVEIKAKNPYPEDYNETTELAKKEKEEGILPEIIAETDGLATADVIFLGSPCWWGTISSPVKTFLKENDLSGKTIIPFITHGGSGMGEETLQTIKEMCPKSTVLDGKAFGDPKWVSTPDSPEQEVKDWIETLK